MDFALDEQQQAWVKEVREFLRAEFDLEAEAEARRRGGESSGPVLRKFRAKMAERGWLALTWPVDYGGSGRSTFEQFLLMDEFAYWGAPAIRSEERRVGKEGRSRWSPDHLKKKKENREKARNGVENEESKARREVGV